MSYIASNLKHLRKKSAFTQTDLASKIGVNRSVIGAYEEGRAEPKLKTLLAISHYFKLSLDDLIKKDLSTTAASIKGASQGDLRILPITIDKDTQEELVPLVPVRAAAGYADGYGDIDFIESLPQFQLPFTEIKPDRTHRIFQIEGDSMLPISPGSYILTEYLENWTQIRDYQCHVVVTQNDGVVYKRTVNRLDNEGRLKMISDNTAYSPYELEATEVKEVWKALGYVTFDLPDGRSMSNPQMEDLVKIVTDLKKEVSEMKSDKIQKPEKSGKKGKKKKK